MLGDLLSSVLATAGAHPWAAGLVILVVLVSVVDKVRTAVHGWHEKDLQRLFVGADRATLLARAGRRCEHHS